MRCNDWQQHQLDIKSGEAMDRHMTRSNPQDRRITRQEAQAGCWECRACESFNDPEQCECWQCEQPREG